jgi:hypothetical protein
MFNRNASFLAVLLLAGLAACSDDDPAGAQPLEPGGIPSYTLGGTVSGLTGSLTLQNTNGATVAVTANGTFTFAAEVPNGAAYTVTVSSQPNSQTCTVANGSGSILNANVTNIAVTCAANPFLLHVIVSGLGAGKSLVLQGAGDGGNGVLTVNANGEAAFPMNLVAGAEYIVFVQTQPTGQTCTVENPEGEIDPVLIATVTVTCIDSSASAREWRAAAPVQIDTDPLDSNSLDQPQIVYDAAGNALAVWRAGRVGEAGSDIAFSRYTRGSGWSTPGIVPRRIPEPSQFAGFDTRNDPRLAINANGDAVLIVNWQGAPMASFGASFYDRATNTFGDLEWIYTAHPDMPAGGSTVDVKMDDAGNVLVVFDAIGGIQYARYRPGDGWITPLTGKLAAPIVEGATREPVLAMNAAGDTVCVWKWRRGIAGQPLMEPHLYSSRYDMDADTWSDPVIVDSDDIFDANEAVFLEQNVMMDPAGNVFAIWTQSDGERLHVKYGRLTGDTWSAAAIVETGNTGETGNAYDVHAAMDGNGNVMAMWIQNDSQQGHYVANRYVPGAGWGTQQVIGDYAATGFAAANTEIELVSNAAGDVIALWTLYSDILPENQLAPYQVLANEYNAATGEWGAPDVIDKEADENPEAFGEATEIAVAIDAAGNATAIWTDMGSPQTGIRAAHFE